MIRGILTKLCLTSLRIQNNRHVLGVAGISLHKSRQFSSKPDLFTLDLDFDADDILKDTPKSETLQGEKENSHINPKNDFGLNFANKPHISETSQNLEDDKKTDATHERDRDNLDSILADIVFDSEANSESVNFESDSLFGDLFPVTNGATTREELMRDPETSFPDSTTNKNPKSFGGSQNNSPHGHVIADEKELFAKIFATYSQEENSSDASDKLHNLMLSNLQDSFVNASKPTETVSEAKQIEILSEKESHAIEKHTKEALSNTLEYITQLPTKESVVDFTRSIFHRFQETEFQRREFYLHKLKGESSGEYLKRHDVLSEHIKQQSERSPETPEINVFTMPVIFNHVISVLATKYYDGALALTLFNSAKEDLHLYTNVCNQKTYNEMLKVYWVFFGKRSLCEIELIAVEMMNNGFLGDAHTFVILKDILTTYHSMKRGQTGLNPGGSPIWSKEDEKRARNLSFKLKKLGAALQREKFGTKKKEFSGNRKFSKNREFSESRDYKRNNEHYRKRDYSKDRETQKEKNNREDGEEF